jgi:YVTN family beta-propeller protein
VLARIQVGREPEGVRVSPDGHWVLVTSESDNAVAIIDARKHAPAGKIRLGRGPWGVIADP